MAYTLRLLTLECMRAQEIDGDETYLKLNGEKIWSAGHDKMNHNLSPAHCCSQFDFAGGRKLTREGWVNMSPFDADAFVFRGLSGTSVVQLWDADVLTSDDLLGETPITEDDLGRGHISILFTLDGSNYRLTYQVDRV